jgi:hypothetical protein
MKKATPSATVAQVASFGKRAGCGSCMILCIWLDGGVWFGFAFLMSPAPSLIWLAFSAAQLLVVI